MYKYVLSIILLFCCTLIFSQSIQRSTSFSSSGSYANIGSLQLQSNIGELMITTYSGTQNMLSQGFVQPDQLILTLSDNNTNTIEAKVFPNPVINRLFIEINTVDNYTIEVYDVLGKKQIIDVAMGQSGSKQNFELNFEAINSGIYFVRITSLHNQLNKIFKIYKIR